MNLWRKKSALLSGAVILAMLYPLSGRAQECSGWWAQLLKYRPISPEASLVTFGQAERKHLPAKNLRLVLWNVHKHSHKGWERDFARLERNADLLLFQEITADQDRAAIAQAAGKEWTAARSYETEKFATGVATGSRAAAVRQQALRSPMQEPLLRTPKSALLSEFPIEGTNQNLLVINVHAINFTRLAKFRAQLHSLDSYIRDHRGPIIVAGDMNTWSRGRIEALRSAMAEHGLREAAPRGNAGWLNLDRVFVRGLAVREGQVMKDVKSSDHLPIYFELDLER